MKNGPVVILLVWYFKFRTLQEFFCIERDKRTWRKGIQKFRKDKSIKEEMV